MVVSIIQKMAFDNIITPTPEQLARAGLRNPSLAIKNFGLLRQRLGDPAFSELQPMLFSALQRTADPDMALNNFERFLYSLDGTDGFISLCRSNTAALVNLITALGSSRFLSQIIISSRDYVLSRIAEPGFPRAMSRTELESELSKILMECSDEKCFLRALRIFRRHQMLRIGLMDLLHIAQMYEIASELSRLAEVCLEAALERVERSLKERYGRPLVKTQGDGIEEAGFSVIAMGKLGGEELNFSSDIDLMYVYAADGETEGIPGQDGGRINRISNHEYFVKMSERLTAAISEKTEDGFVFRVDLRLRPEGQRGPLCQSLGGYEIYYESWGQTWERAALIKARPVAGNSAVGKEFMKRIAPFVFRKYLDFGAIAEIREMKQKINRDVEQKGGTLKDVKLGYGGIREIEFVVQALQLIYGGRDRSMRERNTLKALHMLSQKKLITFVEHETLSKAYVFMRRLEHMIQIQDDLQTHTIPSEPNELRALARRMGYLETGKEAERLLADYAVHTKRVRKIYDALFGFMPSEQDEAMHSMDYAVLLDPETTEHNALDVLKKSGFREPGGAYRNLNLLREGPAFVHQTPRARRLFNRIFQPLFKEIISSPDPDLALHMFESYLAALGSWDAFPSMLIQNPALLKIPVSVFSNSEYFSRMLIRSPRLLEELLDLPEPFSAASGPALKKALLRLISAPTAPSDRLDSLRRFKNREEIRIGMADILSVISQTAASRSLSRLAEACLTVALWLAHEEVSGKKIAPNLRDTGLAVIGLGKLGGRELTYGSDLDILFVHSDSAVSAESGLTAFEYFNKVAEKTVSYLSSITREGFAYRVDTRLRPAGSKGPLCQSIDAFRNYYSGRIQTWERQALINARAIAGDRQVGAECVVMLKGIIYKGIERPAAAADIRDMRRRMEMELGKETAAHYNIKQGMGGIVDIEFIVQFLQLVHGADDIRLRVPGIHNALLVIKRRGMMPLEKWMSLWEAYQFLRRLESRIRIISNQATNTLPRAPEKLWTLARRLGYSNEGGLAGERLLRDYESVRSRTRALFEELIV